jgi:glutathione S-transferase
VSDGVALRIERAYDAPAAAVFEAWTSEEVLRRWFRAGDEGWETPEALVELRVGGAVRIVMREPDGTEHGGGGHYTEVDPPHRLAFTWTWDGEDRQSLIELELAEVGGATTVVFTHSGLKDEETVRDHEGGWRRCFDNLERVLAG